MAADTEIIAGYEVYTPEAAAELPQQGRLQHPLGMLFPIRGFSIILSTDM